MLIKYIGHACFKVRDNETGYSVIFDPYQEGSVPGTRRIVDSASEVRCSHDHFDHNSVESVKLEPAESSPFEITFIDCWHDNEGGAKRGPNRVHILKDLKTGERLVHYGDLGENIDDFLTEERLAILKDADVALIPVGGYYTINSDQALELIRRTTPKLAVPMHFKADNGAFGYDVLEGLDSVLTKAVKAGFDVRASKLYFYDTAENDLKDCILAIRPQNI